MTPSIPAPACCFAQRHGLFRPYHDTVFPSLWSHDLEIDEAVGTFRA